MPCNCDHLYPSEAEKHRKKAAQVLKWLLPVIGRKVEDRIVEAADHVYGDAKGMTDYDQHVRELCDLMKSLGRDKINRLAVENISEPMAKVLLEFRDEHDEADRRRLEDAKYKVERLQRERRESIREIEETTQKIADAMKELDEVTAELKEHGHDTVKAEL